MASTKLSLIDKRVRLLKALAHPSRLAITQSLQEGEQCVCDLRDVVKADLSTVSKHLSVLKAAGIVDMEKRGQNVFYRLRCSCLLGFLDCVDSMMTDSK